jgi:hypothetical protein
MKAFCLIAVMLVAAAVCLLLPSPAEAGIFFNRPDACPSCANGQCLAPRTVVPVIRAIPAVPVVVVAPAAVPAIPSAAPAACPAAVQTLTVVERPLCVSKLFPCRRHHLLPRRR